MNQFKGELVESVVESHEAFLSRRGMAMSGMIGSLSARLEIINMNLRFDMEYDAHMTADQWRRSVKQSRIEILETLISYQEAWSAMQNYQAGEVGKDYAREQDQRVHHGVRGT
jgi:hypothetical protein